METVSRDYKSIAYGNISDISSAYVSPECQCGICDCACACGFCLDNSPESEKESDLVKALSD
jgi:hypothetical protein